MSIFSANTRLLVREPGGVFQARINPEITTSYRYLMDPETYLVLPEKTDVKWQVVSVSDIDTTATAEIPFVDFDND